MRILMVLVASLFVFSCASSKKTEGAQAKDTAAPAAKDTKEEAKTAAPKKAAAKVASTATCTVKGDTRKLAIATPDGGGCEVHYVKFGNENVIANAQNDMNYCQEVFGRVKGKLEEAGFSCE